MSEPRTARRYSEAYFQAIVNRYMQSYEPELNSGCWLWTGPIVGRYGSVCIKYKKEAAHRFFYKQLIGPVLDNLEVCHKCDTPLCVNPNHLFIGSHKDNMDDCTNKKRRPNGEKNGRSKLTNNDVINIRNSNFSMSELAAIYDVCPTTIEDIVKNITWKHLI